MALYNEARWCFIARAVIIPAAVTLRPRHAPSIPTQGELKALYKADDASEIDVPIGIVCSRRTRCAPKCARCPVLEKGIRFRLVWPFDFPISLHLLTTSVQHRIHSESSARADRYLDTAFAADFYAASQMLRYALPLFFTALLCATSALGQIAICWGIGQCSQPATEVYPGPIVVDCINITPLRRTVQACRNTDCTDCDNVKPNVCWGNNGAPFKCVR